MAGNFTPEPEVAVSFVLGEFSDQPGSKENTEQTQAVGPTAFPPKLPLYVQGFKLKSDWTFG